MSSVRATTRVALAGEHGSPLVVHVSVERCLGFETEHLYLERLLAGTVGVGALQHPPAVVRHEVEHSVPVVDERFASGRHEKSSVTGGSGR